MPQRRTHFPSATNVSTPQKRSRSSDRPAHDVSSGRYPKRVKSTPTGDFNDSKSTPHKSPYFEHSESESGQDLSSVEEEQSGYEDEDASVASGSVLEDSDHIEDEAYASSESNMRSSGKHIKTKSKSNGTRIKMSSKKSASTTIDPPSTASEHLDLWRPGVKLEDEPGKAVFIPLPQPRATGSTPYESQTLHPNTFLFLRDLAVNNDRDWLKFHDKDYRNSKRDWDTFVDTLTESIIQHADDTIPELPAKDLTFRIYRDVRFSSDPTPYKPFFSAAWSRTGRKGPYAGYYVQIRPGGESFVGGGVWCPEAEPLAKVRRSIDRHASRLKSVLMHEDLSRLFFASGVDVVDETSQSGKGKALKRRSKGKGKAVDLEDEIVAKFVGMNKDNALKTKPRDYNIDHPEIGLLRLRNYTIGKKVSDKIVQSEAVLQNITNLIKALAPFVIYLNSIVMPDEPPSDESEFGGESEIDEHDDEPEDEGSESEDDEPQ